MSHPQNHDDYVYFYGGGPLDGIRRLAPWYPVGYRLKVVVHPAKTQVTLVAVQEGEPVEVENRWRVGHYEVRLDAAGTKVCVWRGVIN